MARLRTFIALDIGKSIRERLVGLQQELDADCDSAVKWVEPENLHVTLIFLGEVADREVPAVCQAVSEVACGRAAFSMTIESVGAFPTPRRPRVLWAGVAQGRQEVCAIHDDIEPALLELGCYRREERSYTPHITIGRVRGEGAGPRLSQAVVRQTGWKAGTVTVREVLIMSSELTPQGPVYTVMGRAPLSS